MKKSLFIAFSFSSVLLFFSCDLEVIDPEVVKPWQCGDPFTDPRDGKQYNTVWIDVDGGHDTNKNGSCWMAQSLDFDSGSNSHCYVENNDNCSTYGRLYNAFGLDNISPGNWHIATNEEWGNLFKTYGFDENLSGNGFIYSGNVDFFLAGGSSMMEILLGGSYYNPDYENLGERTQFWTPTEFTVSFSQTGTSVLNFSLQNNRRNYVRCVMD